MRVRADLDLCQGHAMCVLEAPEVFAFDAKHDATVRLLVTEPTEVQLDAVRNAIRFCPTMALSLDD